MDAAFFHLYLGTGEEWTETSTKKLLATFPTPRHAADHIMETFPIVKRRDEASHGHYVTRDTILEIYDEMATATKTGRPYLSKLAPPPGPPVDSSGNFIDYSAIANNPPPHIHLPRDLGFNCDKTELQLSDLKAVFPRTPFVVLLGPKADAARVRVTPVSTNEVREGDRVVVASPALRLRGVPVPAVIGKLSIESRTDAKSGEVYLLITLRSEGGVALARYSEHEWKALTTIGVVEDQA